MVSCSVVFCLWCRTFHLSLYSRLLNLLHKPWAFKTNLVALPPYETVLVLCHLQQ